MPMIYNLVRVLATGALLACAVARPAAASNYGLQPFPNLELKTGGSVHAIARAPGGALVIGGEFREVDGVPRRNLARLNADGTLDASWNPSPDGPVGALAVDTDGTVYAGGGFGSVGGQNVSALARIDAVTGQASPAFRPNPDNDVASLVLDGNGMLYVGGSFAQIGGQNYAGAARIALSTGAVDTSWPVQTGYVQAIALDGGFVYLCGYIESVNGVPRASLARVAVTGATLDTAWAPEPDSTVMALAITGGNLYAAGYFTHIGGATLPGLARIPLAGTTGSADAAWTPAPDGNVTLVAADAAGHVVAVGDYAHIGGASTPSGIAQLATVGAAAASATWVPQPGPAPFLSFALNVLPDGRVLLGGETGYFSGALHAGLVRLAAGDASADADFTAQVLSDGNGLAVRALADGSFLLGGDFVAVGAAQRSYLVHLHADGSLDTGWPLTVDGPVRILRSGSGAFPVYLGGTFRHVGGAAHGSVARIALDGTVDSAWTPTLDTGARAGHVYALEVNGADTLFVGGVFDHANGSVRNNVAKFISGGTLDAAWAPSVDEAVYTLAQDGAGSLFLGGEFATVTGQPRMRLAKVDVATGALDAAWTPAAGTTLVRRIAYNAEDHMLYVAGGFTSLGGNTSIRRLGRVSALGTGAVDATWAPNLNRLVRDLAIDGRGMLYFGGAYTQLAGPAGRTVGRIDLHAATATPDPGWPVVLDAATSYGAVVFGLGLLPGGGMIVTGQFAAVQGQARGSVAAIGDVLDGIFHDRFE